MNIGIIGSGNIGGGLGRRWEASGHAIQYGGREPGSVAAAASFGDVVVIATPWAAVAGVLEQAGPMEGKVLIDATNPIKWEDGPVHAIDGSAAAFIAERTQAKVVKAFNTLGAEHLANPVIAGVTADLFIAGDDDAAKQTATDLGKQLGFNVIDLGPLRNARVVEYIAIAWIHLAMKGGMGRSIAFKVLTSE